jgi:hypothetical protein
MKKKKKILSSISLALLASLLFHQENMGLNVLLFTGLSAISILIVNPRVPRTQYVFSIFPALLCAAFLLFYPQAITVLVWLLCYLLMWSMANTRLKPTLLLLQSLLSIIESPIVDLFVRDKKVSSNPQKAKSRYKVSTFLISFFIVFLFVGLYASGNAMVANILYKIDLSFLDGAALFQSLLYFGLLYGLVAFTSNRSLHRKNQTQLYISSKKIGALEERDFGIAQLTTWTLTLLLLGINVMDLVVLASESLPAGLSYSRYVHKGFYTIIFTMTLAIGLILYFYRGGLHFHSGIRTLRIASYVWISQNLLLAVITLYKNYLYVSVYGLTYKRIAVFLCLACMLIGLTIALQRVKSTISNWNFFNRLSRAAFISFIPIALVPYDHLITNYNLKKAQHIDMPYLLQLDHQDLDLMSEYITPPTSEYHYFYPRFMDLKKYRSRKLEENTWKSWNWYNQQSLQEKQTPSTSIGVF